MTSVSSKKTKNNKMFGILLVFISYSPCIVHFLQKKKQRYTDIRRKKWWIHCFLYLWNTITDTHIKPCINRKTIISICFTRRTYKHTLLLKKIINYPLFKFQNSNFFNQKFYSKTGIYLILQIKRVCGFYIISH